MFYQVVSKYEENETTLALCENKKTANAYVDYLKKEKEKSQKKFFSTEREFTYYEIHRILEDDDILKLLRKRK